MPKVSTWTEVWGLLCKMFTSLRHFDIYVGVITDATLACFCEDSSFPSRRKTTSSLKSVCFFCVHALQETETPGQISMSLRGWKAHSCEVCEYPLRRFARREHSSQYFLAKCVSGSLCFFHHLHAKSSDRGCRQRTLSSYSMVLLQQQGVESYGTRRRNKHILLHPQTCVSILNRAKKTKERRTPAPSSPSLQPSPPSP